MNTIKTTLAGLVAASVSLGGAAAQAEPVNLYGTVEVRSIDRDETDFDTLVDAARIGAKQAVHLSKFPGLEARWQMEFDLANNAGLGTDDRDVGNVGVRKAQINLKGGFGEAIFGRQNNLMAMTKKVDQFKNDSGAFLTGPDRVGNALSYVTPSFGGVNGYVHVVSDVLQGDTNKTLDEDADAVSAGISAVGEGWDLQLAYYDANSSDAAAEQELVSVGGAVSFGALGLFATYQDEDKSGGELLGAGLSYRLNDLVLKGGYRTFENDADAEGSAVHLLADYDLGQGVSTFVQYVEYDSDAEDTLGNRDALSVGIAYNFSTDIRL